MPTLIDSLIVSLELDPSKFDEGQQKALNKLRGFKDKADKQTKETHAGLGDRISSYFKVLQNPMQAAEAGLISLANQSRRMGSSVASGAAAGTEGIMGMAAAGLLAIGVFKAMQGLITGFNQQAAFSALTGFEAKWTGVTPQWMTSLSAAAYKQTGAPQQQTQSWLVGLQSAIQAFVTPGSMQQGVVTPLISSLIRMGINPFQYMGNPAEAMSGIMNQLESRLHSLKPTQIPAFAAQLGMDPLLAQFLALGPAAVALAAAQQQVNEVTPKETAEALKLQQAERQVELASQSLSRAFMTTLAPALISVLNVVSDISDFFTKIFSLWNNSGDTGVHKHAYRGHVFYYKGPAGNAAIPGATAQEQAVAAAVAHRESGDRNVMNYMNSTNPELYTASGYYQITDTNWRAYAPNVGIDTSTYPTAMSASKQDQGKVFLYMYRHLGLTPWNLSHGGSIPDDMTPAQLSGVPNTPAKPGKPGKPGKPVASTVHPAEAYAAFAKSVMSGQVAAPSSAASVHKTQNNHISVKVDRAPGEDPQQTGHKVATAINRKMAVSNFNVGYE